MNKLTKKTCLYSNMQYGDTPIRIRKPKSTSNTHFDWHKLMILQRLNLVVSIQ